MRTTPYSNRTSRSTALAAAAALTLALSACGSDDDSAASPPDAASSGASPSSGSVSAAHNEPDIAFITEMHPHHAGALEMAELAETRAEDEGVKALAARIAEAQEPEMERMMDMAQAWDVDMPAGDHGGAHASPGDGAGMGMDMTALDSLSGSEFDRRFLEMMIEHHRGALPMARTQLDQGENAQAQRMAEDILRTQQAEITEMQQLLRQL